MSSDLRTFVVVWLFTQAASLLMLRIGSRYVGNRYLMRIGALSERQKMAALDRIWPLTRVRPAVERGDMGTCTVILSSLIVLKTAASFVFGIVMVFWLPLVSVMVPAIVAVHDPDDPTLGPWVRRVAGLQVTSHALAAALGFMVVYAGPLNGRPLVSVIEANVVLVVLVALASAWFAFAAGKVEAAGIVERGI